MKRTLSWQLEKQRTAKGLRELPKCEYVECKRRGMGWVEDPRDGFFRWACPSHAAEATRIAREQRAQREKPCPPDHACINPQCGEDEDDFDTADAPRES